MARGANLTFSSQLEIALFRLPPVSTDLLLFQANDILFAPPGPTPGPPPPRLLIVQRFDKYIKSKIGIFGHSFINPRVLDFYLK